MIVGWQVSSGDAVEVSDDGSWSVLTTSGEGAAGRFGGPLTEPEISDLRTLVATAVESGFPVRAAETPWTAGGTVETIYASDLVGQVEWGAEWPGSWEPLAARIREFHATAAEHPVAALALTLAGDGLLRHIGSEPLRTDGSGFEVEAHQSAADGAIGTRWDTTISGPDNGIVPVGWESQLGLVAAGLTVPAGGTIDVSVTLTMTVPLRRPVTVWASRT